MGQHYRLANYDLRESDGNWLLLCLGDTQYSRILTTAFPDIRFSRIFPDKYRKFSWGAYIYNLTPLAKERLESLLNLLKQSVFLFDGAVDQLFALDYHKNAEIEGVKRSTIGESVYQAKYLHNQSSATDVAKLMVNFFRTQPLYQRTDYIIAVPPSKPNKPFDLPSFLVSHIAAELNLVVGSQFLRKIKATIPMKDIDTKQGKADNIRGAFELVEGHPLAGKSVVLVDDICQTGETLHEVASTLIQGSVLVVRGLVGTKTLKNPR